VMADTDHPFIERIGLRNTQRSGLTSAIITSDIRYSEFSATSRPQKFNKKNKMMREDVASRRIR
jgi:hypothetical protein